MTIDGAIETLTTLEAELSNAGLNVDANAVKLGIEALKARKVWQDNEGFDPNEALPGETKGE